MSMTKKQKQNMIPKIQQHIEELEKDLNLVQSEISRRVINNEIEERKLLILEYQKHINGMIDGRTTFYCD